MRRRNNVRNFILALVFVVIASCEIAFSQAKPIGKQRQVEQVVVELTTEGFKVREIVHVDTKQSVGGVSIGGTEGEADIKKWSYSFAVYRIERSTVFLKMTVNTVSGNRVEKRFSASRAGVSEYKFEPGIKIRAYFEQKAAISQTRPINKLRQMFDYQQNAPLDVKENGVEEKTGVSIHDISYASPKGGRVTAYLVVPLRKGKFAGVIFMHPRPGSRNTFLDEALTLARAGVVSLLIDAPFSRTGESKREFDPTVTKPKDDRDIYIQTVVDLRRGVDLLSSRSDVDRKRIGFVGHSYGAHTGAVLAGVEKRIKAYVIMAGAPSLTEFLRTSTLPPIVKTRDSLTKEQQNNYFGTLATVDPINYIGYVAPSILFFQFGKTDSYPTEETAKVYSEKASNPKLVKFYDAGHALNDEARRERLEWLQKQLKLGKLN